VRRLILSRLLQLPLILLAVYTLTLALAWGIPGNPLDRGEGRRPPPEVAQAMKAQYNLDSFASFYTSYLRNATGVAYALDPRDDRAVFDLGPSLQFRGQRVSDLIASSLPVSAAIGAGAMLLALVLGVALGVAGALRPGSLLDASTFLLALLGVSLPTFLVGSVLLLVFGVWLRAVGVGEWGRLRDLVLPAFTLSLPYAAYIARLTRMGMIEQLSSDYARAARAKGLSESRVVLHHALRNALLPVVSYLGPASALALTGSFVVERIFNVPGMGQYFVLGVQNKDLFLIIGVVLVFSTILVLLNLAVDVLYRWVDPRIAGR
jgi:oligopeptide transport system permease protein